MVSAADRIAFGEYSKLLPRLTGPYRVISARPKYAKISQDGIQNNVSINQLARVAGQGRSNVHITSDLERNADINAPKEASIEEEKSFYAAKKAVGHESWPIGTYCTAHWYGYGP